LICFLFLSCGLLSEFALYGCAQNLNIEKG